MKPIFAAEQIGKSFGTRTVLRTAGVWATPGRVTVLLGRNGAGKSTLIKIAIGQLRAEHGVIIYKDMRETRPQHATMARAGLYYLPERGVLSRWFSVRTHLTAVAAMSRTPAIEHAVEACRLQEILDRPASQLSGGERRRAELGLVVARQPDCLLADEPLMDLSPQDRVLVVGILRNMARQGVAILVTGHEVDVLLDLADDIVWMTAGTTHALGSPDDARAHDQFKREYLGARMLDRRPYTQKDERQ